MQVDSTGSITIDWLTVVFAVEGGVHLKTVAKYCELFFGAGDLVERGSFFHRCHYAFGEGASIYFSPAGDDEGFKRPDAVLDLRGKGLARLSPSDLCTFLAGLAALNVTATRLDVAYDDYTWLITPKEIFDKYRFLVTGPQAGPIFQSPEERDRGSCYFGKRGREGNGVFLNIYDKTTQTDGEIDACRYEVRFSKEKAAEAFKVVLGLYGHDPFSEGSVSMPSDIEGKLSRLLGGLLTGAIDFWAEGSNLVDRNAVRRQRAPFWETIRGRLRRSNQGEGAD